MIYLRYYASLILCFLFACQSGNTGSIQTTPLEVPNHLLPGKTILANPSTPHVIPSNLLIKKAGQGKAISFQTNRVPLKNNQVSITGAPYKSILSSQLPVFIPGQDGLELPDTFLQQNPIKQYASPSPVEAMAPSYKDLSINNLQYLSVEEGMNSSQVLSIHEDREGNLWFGTIDGGVNKYDGKSFWHYTQKQGLSNNVVYDILEDKEGILWFGTGAGVSRFDGLSFQNILPEPLLQFVVRKLLQDRQGNIWIATYGGGAIRYDGEKLILYTQKNGLPHNQVTDFLEDKAGNIWISTDGGGLCKFDGTKFTQISRDQGLGSNGISSMTMDKYGNIWFCQVGSGMVRFDGQSFLHFTTEQGLSSNLARSIMEDSQGNIWLSTIGGGLTVFEGNEFLQNEGKLPRESSFRHYTKQEGLCNDFVWQGLEDSQHNLWFGSQGGGVARFSGDGFTNLTEAQGLPSHFIRSIEEDHTGNLWLGSQGQGVIRFDGKSFRQFNPKEIRGGWTISILEDSQERLWMGVFDRGLVQIKDGKPRLFTQEDGLPSRKIERIIEDSQGNLWIGTFFEGVCKYDGDTFTQYTEKSGLVGPSVISLMEDRKGNIWFGTFGQGLSRLTPQSGTEPAFFTNFTTANGLSNDKIRCMIEDKAGNLWFGTEEGGLNKFDGKHFTQYSKKEGLADDNIRSLTEDADGNLWVATMKGLNCILFSEQKNQSQASSPEDLFPRIITYGRLDGLKGLNFFQNSIHIDSHQTLWLGNEKALSSLDLTKLSHHLEAPRIRLTQVSLGQEFVDFSQENPDSANRFAMEAITPFYNVPQGLELPHTENHLTFSFSAIDWAAPHKISYQYQLQGLDPTWSKISPDNTADYRNLPPGEFIFKVRCAGESGLWSEPYRYPFTVLPPWWQTYWAYTLYILLLLVIIPGIYYWRLGQLTRRNLELEALIAQRTEEVTRQKERLQELDNFKSRFFTNISHEFRTPLTVIGGMTEQVKQEPGTWLEKGTSIIQRNVGNLLNLINQIMDLSKLEAGSLSTNMIKGDVVVYLRYIHESLHSFAESKSVALKLEIKDPVIVMDYDEEKLLRILSNLLSNAIKFTPNGGEVILTVSQQNEELFFEVKDTGPGIPEDKLAYIFDRFYQTDSSSTRNTEGSGIGLALVRELVQLLHGKIEVHSTYGKGCSFQVLLPITQTAQQVPSEHLPDLVMDFPDQELILPMPKGNEQDPSLPELLIVEDNADVIQYLLACLSDSYQISLARNGQEGIKQALDTVPDLIISDVMMPKKDGFELCQALKSDERSSHIPIVLLTAKADADSKITGLGLGADAYLAKPFNKEELLIRLRNLLEVRKILQSRYRAEEDLVPTENPVTQKQDAFILKLQEVIQENLSDASFRVPQLCKSMGMSRTHLHRKITALTGISASLYLQQVRLQKADELMENLELNVGDIAYLTGHSSSSYFSKLYKEKYGINPRDRRKSLR